MQSHTIEDISKRVFDIVNKILLIDKGASSDLITEVDDIYTENVPSAPYRAGKYSLSFNNAKYTIFGQRASDTFHISEIEVLNEKGKLESYLSEDFREGQGQNVLSKIEEIILEVEVPSTPQPSRIVRD